jgi:L-asparaginase II
MANPVLTEVTRGNVTESRHRGAFVAVDAGGAVILSQGDVERPVFPRSAVKAIQALPLVESGAADRFGFTERELALACASHGGEPEHAALARAMLAKAGLDETALECGTHWPSCEPATIALAASGARPTALHNNCSGKHAGFLCTCVHQDYATAGYVGQGHRLQADIRQALEEVTGAPHRGEMMGIDGCAIPTYAVPLTALATGFARMASGHGLARARADAARRLMGACMAHPFLVAGTGFADTRMMQAAPGRLFVKVGAEGVYCGALPGDGIAFALKIDDGAIRGAEVAAAALARILLQRVGHDVPSLDAIVNPPVLNRNGDVVGALRPAGVLAAAVA